MNKYLTIQEATQLLTLGFSILPIDEATGKLKSVRIFRNDPSPLNEPEAFKELTEKRNILLEAHLKRGLDRKQEVIIEEWEDALNEGLGSPKTRITLN